MKKIFLLFVFCPLSIFGQERFEYKVPELLIGKKIKVTENSDYLKKDGYYNFYKKPDIRYNSRIKAKFNDFYNAEFTVINVVENVGVLKNKVLELNNPKIGTVYYNYESIIGKSGWIFSLIDDLILSDDYWCRYITSDFDKFTNKTLYRTTSSKYIYFLKQDNVISIYLKCPGLVLSINKTGVIILLADGSKIENNTAQIEVRLDDYGTYDYSVLFDLSSSDIEKLKKSYITDYRLFIYDFQPHEPLFIQKEFNCIVKN